MNEVQIIPGITEKDLKAVTKRIKELENFAKRIHIDIADGKFVENALFLNPSEINVIGTNSEIELHLMVEEPSNFIPNEKGIIKKVIPQIESVGFSRELLEQLQILEYEIGISLNPETELPALEPFLEYIECVQFMTIHPGFAGQEFLPKVLEKVKEFNRHYPNIPIEIDGGINPETAKLAVSAGASILVSTSYLKDCEDIAKCIYDLTSKV